MAEMNSKQLTLSWPYKRYKAFERELRDATAEQGTKCGEKHSPQRDAENGTWKLSMHYK